MTKLAEHLQVIDSELTATTNQVELLKREAEELRGLTRELEAKAAPRRINKRQAGVVRAVLERVQDGAILIQFDPTDVEARDYGAQLGETISESGWEVKFFRLMTNASPGLHIFLKNTPGAHVLARTLYDALTKARIQASVGLSDSGGDWQVKLYVGPKEP